MREIMPGVLVGIPESILNISNMPLANFKTHQLWTWQHKDNEDWWQDIADYAHGDCKHPLLTFLGKPGTGKTHLAQAIGWEWLMMGMTVFYNHTVGFLDKLRDSYKTSDTSLIVDFAKNASLLILDDLGSEKLTEWAGQELDFIIDYRYEYKKPLIITSNLTLKQLPVRISDRLCEGIIVVLGGESFRRKGGLK